MRILGAETTPRAPLSRFSTVDTRDPDAAQAEIGRIFCSHRLTPVTRGAPQFHAVHNNARHEGFSVNYVAYGADVEIDPGCLDRFFLLQLPLSGAATVRCGAEVVEASPQTASLLSPTLPTLMRWREGTAKLIVLIERGIVEGHLAGLLDRTIDRIEFTPGVALDAPTGAALRSQALLIQSLSDRAAGARDRWPLAHRQLRDSLVGLMLAAQPHSFSAHLARQFAPPAPVHVKRAEGYIDQHAHENLSAFDVASAAGVSLRTLQSGFRQFRDKTLSQALLEARLERWRRALSDPENRQGVVELAGEVGLPNPGRGASAYRRRYGESPAETRRRAGRL